MSDQEPISDEVEKAQQDGGVGGGGGGGGGGSDDSDDPISINYQYCRSTSSDHSSAPQKVISIEGYYIRGGGVPFFSVLFSLIFLFNEETLLHRSEG